jgi:hypothetical protein
MKRAVMVIVVRPVKFVTMVNAKRRAVVRMSFVQILKRAVGANVSIT